MTFPPSVSVVLSSIITEDELLSSIILDEDGCTDDDSGLTMDDEDTAIIEVDAFVSSLVVVIYTMVIGDAWTIIEVVIVALTAIMATDDVIIVWLDDTSDDDVMFDVIGSTIDDVIIFVLGDVIMDVDGWMVVRELISVKTQEKIKKFISLFIVLSQGNSLARLSKVLWRMISFPF